ncbi:hypothetical protein K431DRAFT_284189 [Polychaeton citri CBS 116435]|uniref:BTB domain-containing protein n=1 Tax=Polychaeton citri CBS 116435 TaxID=1314669 RepID=A0A9P4Q9T7_9PEZI|nr:hypothetical protein K431DRAFT_284189 [Polychaeton citri CBS 116435]
MSEETEQQIPIASKYQLEQSLYKENQQIAAGALKEENPLDTSPDFIALCEGSRRGDLKTVQEQITKGVNINARDLYDYTPLILASLCGHFEVVRTLLEQGARCERDTFQGERCLYNALNDRIRNLLLSYDYSKNTDPLQPLAGHITSLLTRDTPPKTADIIFHTHDSSFPLHKFVLSARSPYFRRKLADKPETSSWKLASSIPTQSFQACIRYLYLGEVSAEMRGLESPEDTKLVLEGIDKLSRHLEVERLFEHLLQESDRRLARQRRTEELERGQREVSQWFRENVIRYKVEVDTNKAGDVRWSSDNAIFADVLLQADEEVDEEDEARNQPAVRRTEGPLNSIPIGNFKSRSPSRNRSQARKSVLFPAHRAMLLRSEMLATMFASPFREGQKSEHLHIVPVDCSPEVLEVVLTFLYTEKADFPLSLALDVLAAADMLFIERLKQRAALLISTLGNGSHTLVEAENPRGELTADDADEVINIYDVVRAGWDTRTPRLEEFGARYIAYRLERYIDESDFKELVLESAGRVKERQETDTVELVDDIRYYLSERFRLRFEDSGLDEMMDETDVDAVAAAHEDEGVDVKSGTSSPKDLGVKDLESRVAAMALEQEGPGVGVVRTLDGEIAGDEFAQDAINYQILLGKIDTLLENLKLDA